MNGMEKERNKVWHAGRARKEELDEIDQCRLCEILPELEKTCYATEYCHRQIRMELGEDDKSSGNAGAERDAALV